MSRFLVMWGIFWLLVTLVFGVWLAISSSGSISLEQRGGHSHLGLVALIAIVMGGVVHPRLQGVVIGLKTTTATLLAVSILQPIGVLVKTYNTTIGLALATIGSVALITAIALYLGLVVSCYISD